jgi:predicted DNA-binding protein with PD1-like motif
MRHATPIALALAVTAAALALPVPARPAAAPDTTYAAAFASPASFWTLRLRPGQDLRVELGRFARAHKLRAAFVASCAGSCTRTSIRCANQPGASVREGHFEIVSLTGTLAADGMHVHASFADSTGATFGGHLMDGSIVYTTAEIVIGEQERAVFAREVDPTYGWYELAVKPR